MGQRWMQVLAPIQNAEEHLLCLQNLVKLNSLAWKGLSEQHIQIQMKAVN